MAKYAVWCTVNSPKGDCDYNGIETDSLDEVMQRLVQHHPSATRVVINVVPNTNLPASFADVED